MRSIWLSILLVGCGGEYSPWQSIPQEQELTEFNLEKLKSLDDGSSEPFSFMLAGDPQAIPGQMANLVDEFDGTGATFMTIAGDLTDMGFLKEYELLGNALARTDKPILTVVGNHDGLSNSKKIYRDMFGPLNYTFQYHGVTFIMWNNNAYEWSVDFQFLEAWVRDSERAIVISHQPPDGGTMSASQEATWARIREYPSYIASLHAHVHNSSFKYEDDLPVFVVDRVHNAHHAIITVDGTNVSIDKCEPSCVRVTK